MVKNEVICMFLPENLKCILLLCQDNFAFLATKLKFSTKVDQSLFPLCIYAGVAVYSMQY